MSFYADTSFLVALYLPIDNHSLKANDWMIHHAQSLPLSPFGRLELRSALRQRSARESCSSELVREVFRQIDTDLKDRFLVHYPLDMGDAFRKADDFSEKVPKSRTLDLIHVAAAVQAKAKIFLTFDEQQSVLAKAVGLKTPLIG